MLIKIVPPDLKHAELLHKWRNEPKTLRFNPVRNRTLEELRHGLSKSLMSLQPLEEKATYRWFINCDGEIVGTVSLSEINAIMMTAEIGYMLGESFHGRGVATIAVQLWTEMIFEQTPLRKLCASVAEANIASLRVLEKCGYKQEGHLREHYIIQGQSVNQIVFGLLKKDWLNINSPSRIC